MGFGESYMSFVDPLNFTGYGLGSKKKGVEPRPDYPYMAAENLYKWSTNYQKEHPYDPAAPYQGTLSAGLTDNESKAQQMLSQFQGAGTPQVLGQAAKYTSDVLGGEKFDPRSSDYYKNMKAQILQDAGEAGAAVRHNAASSGLLHSDPRHQQEADLTRKTSLDLATLLSQMYEQERTRMGQSAALAPSIAKYQQDLPLQQIMAGATYGAIPREVSQQNLDRQYGEYQRQVQGAGEPYRILENLSGKSYNPYPAQTFYPNQNQGADMAGTIMKLLPLLL